MTEKAWHKETLPLCAVHTPLCGTGVVSNHVGQLQNPGSCWCLHGQHIYDELFVKRRAQQSRAVQGENSCDVVCFVHNTVLTLVRHGRHSS